MKVIAKLKKPCSDKERADFIVEYNHKQGYQIKETKTKIQALDYDDSEKAEIEKKNLSQELINNRNTDLQNTDFYLMSDYPISDEDLEKIKAYRQALRDLPQQADFPYVEYPKNPLKVEE